jgi:hypothetical protein
MTNRTQYMIAVSATYLALLILPESAMATPEQLENDRGLCNDLCESEGMCNIDECMKLQADDRAKNADQTPAAAPVQQQPQQQVNRPLEIKKQGEMVLR